MSDSKQNLVIPTALNARLKSMEGIYSEQIATLTAERDELFHRLQEYENDTQLRHTKSTSLSPTTTPPPPQRPVSPRHQLRKEPGVSIKPLSSKSQPQIQIQTPGPIEPSTSPCSFSANPAQNNARVIAAMRVRIADLEQIVKEKEDSKNNEIKALKAALADSEKILAETRKEVATLTATLEKERASNELAAISSAKQVSDLKAELERARHRYRVLEAEKRAAAIERGAASGSSAYTLQKLIEMVPGESNGVSHEVTSSAAEDKMDAAFVINKLKRALLNSRKEACYLYAKVAALHQQALTGTALGVSDMGDDVTNDDDDDVTASASASASHANISLSVSGAGLGGTDDVMSQAEYLYHKRTVKILREEINSMCEVLSKQRDVIAGILSYNRFDIEAAAAAVGDVTPAGDEDRGSGREPFNILGEFVRSFSNVVVMLLRKFKEQHDLLGKILEQEIVSKGMVREIRNMISAGVPDVDENGNPLLGNGETLITPGAIRSSLISVTSYAQSAAASEEEALKKK